MVLKYSAYKKSYGILEDYAQNFTFFFKLREKYSLVMKSYVAHERKNLVLSSQWEALIMY